MRDSGWRPGERLRRLELLRPPLTRPLRLQTLGRLSSGRPLDNRPMGSSTPAFFSISRGSSLAGLVSQPCTPANVSHRLFPSPPTAVLSLLSPTEPLPPPLSRCLLSPLIPSHHSNACPAASQFHSLCSLRPQLPQPRTVMREERGRRGAEARERRDRPQATTPTLQLGHTTNSSLLR